MYEDCSCSCGCLFRSIASQFFNGKALCEMADGSIWDEELKQAVWLTSCVCL